MFDNLIIDIGLFVIIFILIFIITFLKIQQSIAARGRLDSFKKEKEFQEKINEFKKKIKLSHRNEFIAETEKYRIEYSEDAVKRSKSVTKGKITEHLAPFLIGSIYDPSEITFLGSPIDLISFNHINDQSTESKNVSITFIEIKTGNSQLNKKQKLIRDAIIQKRVYYKKLNMKY